jgi:O-antigen/teichoic acid export membrane protein
MGKVHRQMQLGFLVVPAGLGMQLITMLLIASHLGPSDFGIYSIIMSIANVVIFVISMGLGTNLTRLVAEGKHPASYYVALSLPLVCAFTVLTGIILVIVSCLAYSPQVAGWPSVIAAAGTVCFGLATVFSGVLNGLQKIEKWMIWFLGHKIAMLVLVLAVLRPLHGGIGWAQATGTIANFVMMFYAAAALWGETWRGELRWNLKEVRELIGGSITVALTAAVTRVAVEIDSWILAIFAPEAAAVGVYSAGKRMIVPAAQVLNASVSVPTFPGLCRLASENRREFSHWSTQLCVIQWIAALAMALAGWVLAPYVVPHLLRKEGFHDTVHVIQILVWSLVPILFSNQLRYVYIALSNENRFIVFNLIYLVLKALILALCTWAGFAWGYGVLGTCYGAILAELVLALMVWFGLRGSEVRLRFGWLAVAGTVVTAGCVAALWELGDAHHPTSAALALAYLVVAVYVVNRLMRTVREHVPRRAPGAPAAE